MRYDFKDQVRGDTFKGAEFEVLENGVAVNLANYRIRMHLRTAADSTQIQHLFDTDNATITITDALAGKFVLEPVIINLPARMYVYDIEFTSPAGVVRTWVRGNFPIVADVTR
jgi:hypothetical protein